MYKASVLGLVAGSAAAVRDTRTVETGPSQVQLGNGLIRHAEPANQAFKAWLRQPLDAPEYPAD